MKRAICLGVCDTSHHPTGTLGLVQVFSNAEYTSIWVVDDLNNPQGSSGGSGGGFALTRTAGLDATSSAIHRRNPITCISIYDIDQDGKMEIIVGRDDGRIEVFKQQPDSLFGVPFRVFNKDIGESVRAIECGIVSTPDFHEIVVASYSGKIISFTTEPVLAEPGLLRQVIQTINNENRIKFMRKEVDDLKKRLEKERKEVQGGKDGTSSSTTRGITSGLAGLGVSSMNLLGSITGTGGGSSAAAGGSNAVSTPDSVTPSLSTVGVLTVTPAPEFALNSKFYLDAAHAAYVLSIELQGPIDLVLLRCPVVLDLVEAGGSGGSQSSSTGQLGSDKGAVGSGGAGGGGTVLSVTPAWLQQQCNIAASGNSPAAGANDPESGGKFVAVFRCQSREAFDALPPHQRRGIRSLDRDRGGRHKSKQGREGGEV